MINSLLELDNDQVYQVIDELKHLSPSLRTDFEDLLLKIDVTYQEAIEYLVSNDPKLWAKVYLDWEARDYQIDILNQGRESKKLVLRLGRRLGKCLPGNMLIPDSSTGEYITVEELYKKQKANIFSLNEENNNIVPHSTNIIFENGVKPVYRITTRNGREIEATGNHPFYTINGFVDADNLKVGDYIAIASNMKHSNPISMDENKIKYLAYMIADGNYKGGNLRFSCAKNNIKVLTEMDRVVKSFDCNLVQYESNKSCDYHIVSNIKNGQGYVNNANRFLKEVGIYNQGSHDKVIPNEIFKLNNNDLKIFISRLYSADGWATYSVNDNGKIRTEIGYATVSKTLAVQLQSLLLRFGINSTVRKKKVKYNGGTNIAYSIDILNVEDVLLFCENIGIYAKEEAIKKVKSLASSVINYGRKIPGDVKKYIEESAIKNGISKADIRKHTGFRFDQNYRTIMSSKVERVCEYIGDKSLEKYYKNNIIWDEIVKIEFIDNMPTYDLTVPKYHNFVVNDFVTHNTENMCILILWYAYTQINACEEGRYDILIITPYETQVDLIFDRLKQLIDGSPLFKGMITRDVYHRIELSNGTKIKGLTAGTKSSSGAASTRGQHADKEYFYKIAV